MLYSHLQTPIKSCCVLMLFLTAAGSLDAESLVYEGSQGPGFGKHIVFLAGDHEYRSEETLPALARVLAKHHGFKCTVLFTVDPATNNIVPGCNNIPGLDALEIADLMVIFLRFQDLPEQQMQYIVDYLDRAGPVVGLRTSTHAFRIPAKSPFAKYSSDYEGSEYLKGFGRQVLGESWAGHNGKNHQMSTRLNVEEAQKEHPILRGVEKMWVQSGCYWTDPMPDSTILAMAQPLETMHQEAAPAAEKQPCPGAWVRTYENQSGEKGRVFTTTYGASEDIVNEGFRRLLVNGCIWAMGLEGHIQADANVSLVGSYNPTTFGMGGYRQGIKPLDLAGWNAPIMSSKHPVAAPQQ